jgi:hypothetical protein
MGGYPLGYPDIRQDFRGKGTSASTGGYPPADSGYPETISMFFFERALKKHNVSVYRPEGDFSRKKV